MQAQIDRINELKTEGKNQRDRGVRGFDRAVRKLDEAIALAREGIAQSTVPEVRARLAKELADCYGLIGGIHRRWAAEGPAEDREKHLAASIVAYERGFELESDPQYGIVNSYNLVNRLIGRLLLRPDALAVDDKVEFGPEIPPMHIGGALEAAGATIREQLAGPRHGDYWAMADLALVELLLGKVEPSTAYADFNAKSPPDFAYTSVLAGLTPLADLPLKKADALQDAIKLLEAHRARLQT